MGKNKKVEILDCTLRDGGYVNDWHFGADNAKAIVSKLSQTGVDYIELGFIRLCEYNRDVIQFSRMAEISELFKPSKQKLGLMVEIGYGYPVANFPYHSENAVDIIRLVLWKRLLKEGLEYCKVLKQKGYEIGVQATRTDQYSLQEFADLCRMYNEINPKAVYIVDTFGLFTKERLIEYASVADEILDSGIRIGYHAHNNMQQAFSNMVAFVEHNWKHDLMVDASVMGMGRGAGNLCLELMGKYMNEHGANMNLKPMYEVAETYLMPFYHENPWGYSIPYLLSAMNGLNPSYVKYMQDKNLSISQIAKVYATMKEQGSGITYDTDMCDKIIALL